MSAPSQATRIIDRRVPSKPETSVPIACKWCGAPSGRKGVTLQDGLCPPCLKEFVVFGHLLSFKDWFLLFVRFVWTEIPTQWRFRRHGVKVRADNYGKAAG